MNEFRTVQYQGADTKAQPYVTVPDGQAALESNANYQRGQLQRAGEALLQQNALAARNQERVDQIALQNSRLSAEQMNARNQAELNTSRIYGEQKLANSRMRKEQALEIQKLQYTNRLQQDEFDLRSKQQQAEALTQFGQQMIQFSTSLWQAKAADINKKNEEMKSYGMMDELLGVGKVTVGDQIRVDQAEYTKLGKQGEAMQLADTLEKAGLPNDAARVRSSNPWYLRGRQEMAIIKGASEMPDYLRKSVQEAESAGLLVKGDPDYDLKVRTVVYEGMRNFMKESGIVNMNPTLVARYLQSGFLNAMTSITTEFNRSNNQYVKQATAATALGDAMISDQLWSGNPGEVNKSVSQVLQTAGINGLKDLFEGTSKRARLSGDDSALVALMQHPAMQAFQGDYANFERVRRAEAQAAMEKEQQNRTKELISTFNLRASEANPADIPALRGEILEQAVASGLSVDQLDRVNKAVWGYNIQDAGNMSARLDDVLALGNENDISQFVRNNPNLTNEQKAEAQKAIEARQKMLSPEQKIQLQQAKNLILETLPSNLKSQAAVNPFLKQQIDAVVKQREATLEQRARVYWSRPDASPEGFQEWLDKKNADITKRPISIDSNFSVPELGEAAKVPKATISIPPTAAVSYNGRNVVWMTTNATRQALLTGSYGQVNANNTVVLTKQEVAAWSAQYEEGGVFTPELLTLAVRTRTKPQDLLRIQAKIHNMPGELGEPNAKPSQYSPKAYEPGQPVSRQRAVSKALSAGLSPRGAIWYATNMMDESSGRPTAVHDGGDGYGLFGHQGGRLEAMRAYAASKGIDISNPEMQMDFALNEIRTRYPDTWATITSPNPTLNDLWRASKAWEGFAKSVYARRFNSLKTALGE